MYGAPPPGDPNAFLQPGAPGYAAGGVTEEDGRFLSCMSNEKLKWLGIALGVMVLLIPLGFGIWWWVI